MPGILRGALRERAAAHPVIRDMAIAGVRAVAERLQSRGQNVTETERADIEEAIVQEIASDAVLVNNVGGEPLNGSRTFRGGATATVGGLGIILSQIGDFISKFDGSAGYGWAFWVQLAMIVFGALSTGGGLQAMIGRASTEKTPMTLTLWKPWTWFAPRAE